MWKWLSTKADETRSPAASMDLKRLCRNLRPDLDDTPIRDGDIDALAPVRQSGVTDEKVEHQRACLSNESCSDRV
jgi:hypothetical protein